MEKATHQTYEQLDKMGLQYVSGSLLQHVDRGVLEYKVNFRLSLDFDQFETVAERHIPAYLKISVNAIRPELDGLAYHHAYNDFANNAGSIVSNADLFRLFTHPRNYTDATWSWDPVGIERMYSAPIFEIDGNDLLIFASQSFRRGNQSPIEIRDLPLIGFRWALLLLEGHERQHKKVGFRAPSSIATLGYYGYDMVEVEEGIYLPYGMRYMVGSRLSLGLIDGDHILVAGH